jgi:hypothetical protein
MGHWISFADLTSNAAAHSVKAITALHNNIELACFCKIQ